jgi:DNA polymerase-3 subunit beta
MQFNIKKDQFLKALNKVQGIIEKKHTLAILSNVLIEAKDNKIIVTATDLEIGIKSIYDADIIETGKITISAKKLFEIIKELPNSNINFNTKNNYWIEIKCENSLFNLVALSPDDFPKFPELNTQTYKLNTKLLSEIIEKTIFSVSNDETKFNLTGIYIESENDIFNFVSTDGHRLSLVNQKIDNINDESFDKGFILPKKGILELKKVIDDSEEDINIGVTDNNFFVSNDQSKLIMRMIDGDFPDYKRVIPEKGNNVAEINRETFLHALKRISILSSEKSKGVKLSISKNLLVLSSSNPDLGDAKEEIQIIYEGNDISIGFNARYIIDILQVIKTDQINLFLKDNISPGRISPADDEKYLTVIMPMRI